MANTLKAVVGALETDAGAARAHLFIQHFILTQLVGKDINELLLIRDPMCLVAILLKQQGLSEPEPRSVLLLLTRCIPVNKVKLVNPLSPVLLSRLLHQAGSSTLLSCYMVGIYVDKKLMGKSMN